MPIKRIVIEDDSLDRLFAQTEPGTELVLARPQPENDNEEWAGVGPARGEYEARRADGRIA